MSDLGAKLIIDALELIKNNADLLKLSKGNSIDPARVRQADSDVMMALFVKLDDMVRLLYSQGKVPWKSFAKVPAKNIYNMDKVATNCHDHRKKMIAWKSLSGRLFQECCSGDNKMPRHITLAITSCADGKLNELCFNLLLLYVNQTLQKLSKKNVKLFVLVKKLVKPLKKNVNWMELSQDAKKKFFDSIFNILML